MNKGLTNEMFNSTEELFSSKEVVKKFNEIMGKKSASFVSSVLQIVSQSDQLKNAEPKSIVNAALTAATLDLPINNNLGLAYIIPYTVRQPDGTYKQLAQFQLGYKAFIQLAIRSGQFKKISASPVYEGQLIEENPLTGFEFDWKIKSDKLIGFAGYFQLIDGFEKTLYMSVEQLQHHGAKYSKTFNQNNSRWKVDFDSMAMKTVLKLLLSKYAPLSVDMQRAQIADHAVIKNAEMMDVEYVDNTVLTQDQYNELKGLLYSSTLDEEERETVLSHINDFMTEEDFKKCKLMLIGRQEDNPRSRARNGEILKSREMSKAIS